MSLTELEQQCLESFRSSGDGWPTPGQAADDVGWIRFALAATLHAGRMVRAMRALPLQGETAFKDDASPVTAHEREIEWMIRGRLSAFCPDATFLGEESGGGIALSGISVAVDPVDGTWALLNRMSTFSVVLAAFRGAEPFLGVIANPATGDIGYAAGDGSTRMIQLDAFGERDVAVDLPLDRARADSVLVNVHPARKAGPTVERLMAAWQSNEIQMVRMEGGSPAAALLDAAKGSFVYVNLWDKRPAEPFDLA
ncbi:MAG: inositol monophosphatase family protein, partial [Planctomycetota bacterium]